jgi:predicted PhzF superfamily epimerase YddE/YHI9
MIPLSVVDAFTDKPFAGNPAAVCLLQQWPSEEWLQLLGREMNLSETAFLVPRSPGEYELRWFTPKVEVALCGHATLASAHFLWESGTASDGPITFQTRKSGPLAASRLPSGEIELDFPPRPARASNAPVELDKALGARVVDIGRNGDDYLIELESAAAVRELSPDFEMLARIACRGVIVTARSDDPRFEFVSRFFAPGAGIAEDPVTGSAHCCLSEWWGEKFGKDEMTGYQASERGGAVRVKRANGRVKLIGRAVTVTIGHLAAVPS